MSAEDTIGSTFNFMYPHYKKIQEAFDAGNHEKARTLQNKANNIMEAFCSPAIKYVLTLQGIDAGKARRPFLELKEYEKKYVRQIIESNLVC